MSQSTEQHPIAYVERPRVALAQTGIESEIELVMQRLHSHGWTVGGDGQGRPPSQAEALTVAYIATQYGLDPLLGEVLLLGSKVYIPHAALERRAREQKLIRRRRCRPASPEERAAARVEEAEEYWVAEVETVDGLVYEGHGMAAPENVGIARRGGQVDRRIVRNMAEKRAMQRALRYAVGVSLPDPEDGPVIVGMAQPEAIADKSAALAQAAAAFGAKPAPAALPEPPQQVVTAPQAHVEPAPVREVARPVEARQQWVQTLSDEDIRVLQRRIDLLIKRGVPESSIYEVFIRLGADKDAWVVSLPAARLLDAKVELQGLQSLSGGAA